MKACGPYVSACGRKVMVMDEKGRPYASDPLRCGWCGHFKAICSVNAPNFPPPDNDDFTNGDLSACKEA